MSSYETLPGQGADFAKGASGPANVYDTSPTGLGLSPSYLAPGATATASASISTSVITGQFSGAGAIVAGAGFSVAHPATGSYNVTFTTAFAAAPLVVVSINYDGSGVDRVVFPCAPGPAAGVASTTGFGVFLRTSGGAAVDNALSFLVIGMQ